MTKDINHWLKKQTIERERIRQAEEEALRKTNREFMNQSTCERSSNNIVTKSNFQFDATQNIEKKRGGLMHTSFYESIVNKSNNSKERHPKTSFIDVLLQKKRNQAEAKRNSRAWATEQSRSVLDSNRMSQVQFGELDRKKNPGKSMFGGAHDYRHPDRSDIYEEKSRSSKALVNSAKEVE